MCRFIHDKEMSHAGEWFQFDMHVGLGFISVYYSISFSR